MAGDMKVDRILETCLYAEDLETAREFYTKVLGLPLFSELDGRHLFFRCGEGMLLIFNPAATETVRSEIEAPPHGARGAGHCCFVMEEGEIEEWRRHLGRQGVKIEKETDWPRGGRSLYFRDPAGNSLEIAPRKIWGFDK